jgi:hypothetical protein
MTFSLECTKAHGTVHAAAASCPVMIYVSSALSCDNNHDFNPVNQPSNPTLDVGAGCRMPRIQKYSPCCASLNRLDFFRKRITFNSSEQAPITGSPEINH